MTRKKTRVCRFCDTPQGQQHTIRCLYVTSTGQYVHTIAWVDADGGSPSSSPDSGTSCEPSALDIIKETTA